MNELNDIKKIYQTHTLNHTQIGIGRNSNAPTNTTQTTHKQHTKIQQIKIVQSTHQITSTPKATLLGTL